MSFRDLCTCYKVSNALKVTANNVRSSQNNECEKQTRPLSHARLPPQCVLPAAAPCADSGHLAALVVEDGLRFVQSPRQLPDAGQQPGGAQPPASAQRLRSQRPAGVPSAFCAGEGEPGAPPPVCGGAALAARGGVRAPPGDPPQADHPGQPAAVQAVQQSPRPRGERRRQQQQQQQQHKQQLSGEGMMLGTEVDLQVVESSVVALESVLKAWLHEQAGEREHLHLLLPPSLQHGSTPGGPRKPNSICLKCDIQERLLSPSLLPGSSALDLGTKTESVRDFQPPGKGPANHIPPPQRLRAIKTLHADGVCESVLYGLPLVIRPTTCWQLDWDEIETNQQHFQALCHTLRAREWFLLVRSEPAVGSALASASSVCSHYVLQPSPSLSLLLLKPVVTQELLLPCCMPDSNQDPPLSALITVENSLQQLEDDLMFNPLCLDTNLYLHLRMRGLASRPAHPYRRQGPAQTQTHGLGVSPEAGQNQRREPLRPQEGSTARQQSHGRQSHQGRARATVAPLPPSSGPPAKSSRPSLTFGKRSSSSPSPSCLGESDDGLIMML